MSKAESELLDRAVALSAEDAEQAWRVEIRGRMAESDAGLREATLWDAVQGRLKDATR